MVGAQGGDVSSVDDISRFERAQYVEVVEAPRAGFIAQAREQSHIRAPAVLDAMELGARRIDWIGAKFQFADEIAQSFGRTIDSTRTTPVTWVDLAELSGINGKLQDMRDGYVLTRELFERSWRAENRPYWLQNNLARYDAEIINWVQRINAMDRIRRRHARDGTLPKAEELGVPPALLLMPPPTPASSEKEKR